MVTGRFGMVIRHLKNEEFEDAIRLKVQCWDEELAGVAPNRLDIMEELEFIKGWIQSAGQYNDIRIVLGVFDCDELIGFVGASIAEEQGLCNAIELNYLFVSPMYRGRGYSLILMQEVLKTYINKDFKYLVVYNHHYAPSNAYYKKLGGRVIRTEKQGKDDLEIDIFSFDLIELTNLLNNKINYYNLTD
jgi:GNAT superfamily N-acetyltransferase